MEIIEARYPQTAHCSPNRRGSARTSPSAANAAPVWGGKRRLFPLENDIPPLPTPESLSYNIQFPKATHPEKEQTMTIKTPIQVTVWHDYT